MSYSLEKILLLGGIEGRKRRGCQRMRWLDGFTDSWTWVWVNLGSLWWTGRPGVLRFMGSQRVGHDWASELNWTDVKYNHFTIIWSLLFFLIKTFQRITITLIIKAINSCFNECINQQVKGLFLSCGSSPSFEDGFHMVTVQHVGER